MNTQSARKASEFCRVMSFDKHNKPHVIIVPGHDGAQYRVIIRREKGLTVECHKVLGNLGFEACPGNSNGHICYHAMAALLYAAELAEQQVALCEKSASAMRLTNLGWKAWPVKSFQGQGVMYLAVRKGG